MIKPYVWQTISVSNAANIARRMAKEGDPKKREALLARMIPILELADKKLSERRDLVERHEKALFLLALVEELGVQFIHGGTEAVVGETTEAVMSLDELKIDKAP